LASRLQAERCTEPSEGYAPSLSDDPEAIETERLLLVPWSDDYFDDFAGICADAEVMRFISRGRPLSREDVGEILGRTRSMWEEYGFGPWAAIEKCTGRWVGRIGLNLLADWPGEDRWEVGFELAREFWGCGLATEGARRAIRFGWEQTPLERIISVTVPDHLASRRVMEKCGLTFQAEIPWRGTTVVWYAIDRPHESAKRAES
jgi:RimJ/RimL family protein N-acetyltransferase